MGPVPFLRSQLFLTGFFGLTGVALGAYGSHGLTGKVPPERQHSFLTASHYQIMHSAILGAVVAFKVALVATGMKSASSAATRCLDLSFGLLAAGVIGFSFTIYVKVLGGPAWVGPITPMGGVSFMAGWAALAATAFLL